jgi:hypothetical protein
MWRNSLVAHLLNWTRISSKPFVVDDQTTIILKMLKLGHT